MIWGAEVGRARPLRAFNAGSWVLGSHGRTKQGRGRSALGPSMDGLEGDPRDWEVREEDGMRVQGERMGPGPEL